MHGQPVGGHPLRSKSVEKPVAASLKIFRSEQNEPRSLRVGQRLDKYRLLKRMGEGGFATVFSAQDTIEDRKVALKIPDSRYVSNHQSVEDMQKSITLEAYADWRREEARPAENPWPLS